MNLQRFDDLPFRLPAEIFTQQDHLFRSHVAYCASHSPFYKNLFAKHQINPQQITLANLHQLPLTAKEDLAKHNSEFLAVPLEKIVDIVQSSGTTGQPTQIMYTQHDLLRLAYNERQSFSATGLTASDVVLLTCTMDRCFIAGLAYFMGLRELGAATIRNGHGTMEGHRDILHRTHPTAIVGVPSFLHKLALYLREKGEDPRKTNVRRLICIGEPLRDRQLNPLSVGRELTELWPAQIFSTYASSEIVTTFCECSAGRGGHLLPDLGLVEIVDENGQLVADGQVGEVVVTPLQTEGMPLLRFRTGDISFIECDPCTCGRHTPRLGPILGRLKQMIKFKGTTLYPESIALALEELGGVLEYYVEVTSAAVLSDHITVHLCPKNASLIATHVSDFLSARLRARPDVVIETESAIRQRVFSPQYRKPMRFFDRRQA